MALVRVVTITSAVSVALMLVCVSGAVAAATATPSPDAPFEADHIIGSLNRVLAWYRQARATMRSLETVSGSVFTADDERATIAIVRRAFETARAEAALLASRSEANSAVSDERRRASEVRRELERSVERETAELVRLQNRLRSVPVREHAELQRQIVAAANRIALEEARREMLARFAESDPLGDDVGGDLERQIQALQDSVPELRTGAAAPTPPPAPETSVSGTRALVHRLFALDRSRRSIGELQLGTSQLVRSLDADTRAVKEFIAPLAARLKALAADPTAEGMTLTEGQRTFQALLARAKLAGAILPPLRDEMTLGQRYERTLETWTRALSRDVRDTLEQLALALVGVLVAIVAIVIGAVLWRVAAHRYVSDPYRRRLVMMARRIVVVIALTLVFVFHFANEVTALVAGLGFAAAGIAFALQNVILALAGYFSMMTPHDGIRAGDRVSLQGPFGYVHGDVLDIGLVRIRLRELAGDPLRPTGRIVVFPNSVVFTGSFFKHASSATPSPVPRAESRSA